MGNPRRMGVRYILGGCCTYAVPLAGFVAALGDLSEVTSSGKWPVWLDFNTGLYTSDLDFYVNAFVQVGACTLCSLAVLTLAQLHRE